MAYERLLPMKWDILWDESIHLQVHHILLCQGLSVTKLLRRRSLTINHKVTMYLECL